MRQLPKLLAGGLDEVAIQQSAGYYLANVERLYHGSRPTTGRMIVDSSKLPTYCHLLHQIPSLRLRIVHLVRDPRATAHSWQRLRATGAVDDDDEEMDRFSVWKSTALWDIWNSTARHLFSRQPRLPPRALRRPGGQPAAGDRHRSAPSPGCCPTTARSTATAPCVLQPNHAVAGNPNRRRAGDIELVEDDEWRTALGPAAPWSGHRR